MNAFFDACMDVTILEMWSKTPDFDPNYIHNGRTPLAICSERQYTNLCKQLLVLGAEVGEKMSTVCYFLNFRLSTLSNLHSRNKKSLSPPYELNFLLSKKLVSNYNNYLL